MDVTFREFLNSILTLLTVLLLHKMITFLVFIYYGHVEKKVKTNSG